MINNKPEHVLHILNLDNNSMETFPHNPLTMPLCCFDSTGKLLVTLENESIKIYKKE